MRHWHIVLTMLFFFRGICIQEKFAMFISDIFYCNMVLAFKTLNPVFLFAKFSPGKHVSDNMQSLEQFDVIVQKQTSQLRSRVSQLEYVS